MNRLRIRSKRTYFADPSLRIILMGRMRELLILLRRRSGCRGWWKRRRYTGRFRVTSEISVIPRQVAKLVKRLCRQSMAFYKCAFTSNARIFFSRFYNMNYCFSNVGVNFEEKYFRCIHFFLITSVILFTSI